MWMKLMSADWARGSQRREIGLAVAVRRRSLGFEHLEPRELLSVDLAAVAVHSLAGYAVPGQTLTVQTTVANQGSDASGAFTVEYRLSKDTTFSSDDTLLGTATEAALGSGSTATWSQVLTVPTSTLHNKYYVEALVTAAGDGTSSNNIATDSATTSVLYTTLSGTVAYNGITKSVSIHSYTGTSTPIFDDRATWIVIHGRNSSPSSPNLVQLESTLSSPSDQVLVLDWSTAAASGLLGGAGENYIKPVAKWASSVLTSYGILSDELNLAGHSWGAYVAAELAELEPASSLPAGEVNSIIALSPAADYPGGSYNPTAAGEVNFARNSKFSWAFYAAGDLFGSATTAQTANESFVVKGSDHSNLVYVVANAIARDYGGQFDLNRLLAGVASTAWVANSYDSSGRRSSTGKFEAVLTATSNGLVSSLKYFNGTTEITV
jgi:pimeloyl-ACP methyl ester carboxylesterase